MVKAWKDTLIIPTYEVGMPEKNPMFLENRVYQGSSGVVYPYPVIESISNEKKLHEWNVVWLENEYLKIMILPDLGGRIQMAYDKIKQRHFVYYNQVIKPALVGLTGPWISGGIEFNWPQHHRPSTFLPVDCTIKENKDGSVTVWVGETEIMSHQKGMAGFTLRPGCAYLEIQGRLYNRTNLPQTFLWWANPAVAVNQDYQSVFPQDVHAVFDHGKRAVSSFPLATGTYYKMDYSSGVDISNYKNIKVPTSYMAVNSKFDFEGGYENDTQSGMLHVANRHVSPGKKQWTWGCGDFGKAWDRNLTDEDGPYIELMAGVFTENQPDFSWLMPYEEKEFTQYFMPYRELGVVKNASKDLLLNVTQEEQGKMRVRLFATHCQSLKLEIYDRNGDLCAMDEVEISPETIYNRVVDVRGHRLEDIILKIRNRAGKQMLDWAAEPDEIKPIPPIAEPALRPEEIKTNEQLYLTGIHLEQYRHATYCPADYYAEALRRDHNDYHNHMAMGCWYLRRGRFDLAENHLRQAVSILMKRNPNPYDGEPIYYLGLALKYQGKLDEAYSYFYKSTWNAAWKDAGFFACAQISLAQHRYEDALYEVEQSLIRNARHHKAIALKASILRLSNRKDEAMYCCQQGLKSDVFNYGCRFEYYLLTGDNNCLQEMVDLMRDSCHNYDELAIDYMEAGCREEALQVWSVAISRGATSVMTWYYRGWAGDQDAFLTAKTANYDYAFPNRLEAVLALQAAMEQDAQDGLAPYLLGCLYYDKRQYDLAGYFWKKSAELIPSFATVWRNLAIYTFNKEKKVHESVQFMEKAFLLNTSDARVFMELDQLYKRLGYKHHFRLELLEKYSNLVNQRDDLLLEKITLLNLTGKPEEARKILDSHHFHPWEGGEGKVSGQYQLCRTELAKQALLERRYDDAIRWLEECLAFPPNLGEGKLPLAPDNDFHYLLGCAWDAKGNRAQAVHYWEKATIGQLHPSAAIYYNDTKPEKIFYQGMALRRLGRIDEAHGKFYELINYGKNHLFDKVKLDYFAVSLPDLLIWDGDLDNNNRMHCYFLLALGYYGLGDEMHAHKYLTEALSLDYNHLGLFSFRSFCRLQEICFS